MQALNIIFISLVLVLTGCSSGSETAVGETVDNTVSLSGVVVSAVDVNNKAVSNTNVSITSKSSGLATGILMTKTGQLNLTTDSNGLLTIDALSPGKYEMRFDDGQGNKPVITSFEVSSNSQTGSKAQPKIIIPATLDVNGNLKKVDATVASLSGNINIISSTTSLENVTVTLSSAKIGTIASSSTNADGNYFLIVNLSKKSAGALNDLALSISAKGYKTHKVTGLQVQPNTNIMGFDFGLSKLTSSEIAAEQALIVTSFDFVDISGWNTNGSLWHQHSNGLNIKNAAVTKGLVSLAPTDSSAGLLPDSAAGGSAMWFGATSGSDETGNFLGTSDAASNTTGALNGGQSTLSTSGSLTSPNIDLTGLASGTDISLRFDTWWEIESVNPNASGFDLMTIQYSINNGLTWTDLARLNPLTDPVTDANLNRDSLPYSNNGFNAAPSWVEQEPIPLIDPITGISLAGQNIMLQFSFDTVDTLFNGFRGWIVDNVEVAKVTGTYPVMDPYSLYVDNTASLNWDWMYPAWNTTTNDIDITPVAFDSVTFAPVPLPSGANTTITAVFDYETAIATKAQLAFSLDAGAITPVTSSQVSFPTSVGSGLSISADVTPVSGNNFLDVWVQMLDANNNIVSESPVASYTIQ